MPGPHHAEPRVIHHIILYDSPLPARVAVMTAPRRRPRGPSRRLIEKFEREEHLATPPPELEPRFFPLYTRSEYLLHVGWPFGMEAGCAALEYVPVSMRCCSMLSIAIYYPYIEKYSLARYPDVPEFQEDWRAASAVYGWGKPYEYYMRFEFDTGEDAWSYKLDGWYYYRLPPGERLRQAWHSVYTGFLELLADKVAGECTPEQMFEDDVGAVIAVSHLERRAAVLHIAYDEDAGRFRYHVHSGEGKVLYYFMPKWKYERIMRERSRRFWEGEEDVDDWEGWQPGSQYRVDLGPAWWRVILLARKGGHVEHATLAGALADWTARVAGLTGDPWIRELVLESGARAARRLVR